MKGENNLCDQYNICKVIISFVIIVYIRVLLPNISKILYSLNDWESY